MSPPEVADPMLLRAQARVGHYLREKWRLDHLLGMGGAAAVYSATHRNGSRAAVKILHLELSLDADIRQRFLREGYVANAVEHSSVVRVLDDDIAEDGSVYLVMELLVGETMEDRMRRAGGRLPADEVLAALDPVLSALASAHAKGIVHRDIKPENLFLHHDGTIRLLDFGIARLRESGTATRSGSMLGTPAYMPPEQALGRTDEVGPRSDVWAVGATMYTLLSGHFVHDGATANEQLVLAATRTASPLQTVAPFLPEEVTAVVDKALAFDPAERWQDAESMQSALRDAYHALTSSSVETAPRLAVPDRRASYPGPDAPSAPKSQRGTTGPAGAHAFSVLPPPKRRSIVLGAAGLAGVLLLITILLVTRKHGAASQPAPSETASDSSTSSAAPTEGCRDGGLCPPSTPPLVESARAAEPLAPVAPPSSASAESIDALPPANTVPSSGSIRVVVLGGSCAITIDGKKSSASGVQVPAGDHLVTCKAPPDRPQKQSVHVDAGEERTVTFTVAGTTSDPRGRRK